MRYRESLQVRLQERYRRLYKAHWQAYDDEAGYLVDFIRSTPALQFMIENVERSADLDPDEWTAEHFGRKTYELPPTEEGRAKLCWHLLQKWASEPEAAAMFGHMLDRDGKLPEGARVATEQIVEPLIEYLQEHLGESADVLYLLERYVRRVEWFEQQDLWRAYEADTQHGEATYDADVRQFLFEQGIDYPFSQPRSASGEADIVADLSSDEPLVCEVKLFDGASYGKSYLGKGFRQAVQYAQDYGQSSAYLVVINLSEKQIDFPTDGEQSEWPLRVEAPSVTVFFVTVRALPKPSASKQPRPTVVRLTKADLFNESAPAAD